MLVTLIGKVEAQHFSGSKIEPEAIKKFENKEYNEVVGKFEKLCKEYPKEPSYNYFLGRCYLALGRETNKTVELLRYAASKNYETDAHYYLAEAYYNAKEYKQAKISLLNFRNLVKKKNWQKYEGDKLLALIGEGSVEGADIIPEQKILNEDSLAKAPVLDKGTVKSKTNAPIAQNEPKSEYDIVLAAALAQQLICDSILDELMFQHKLLGMISDQEQRQGLFSTIAQTEDVLEKEQSIADSLFNRAQEIKGGEIGGAEKEKDTVVYLAKEVNDIKVYNYVVEKNEEQPKIEDKSFDAIEEKEETILKPEFQILEVSPYNINNRIPINQQLREGLIYRIQLGAYGKQLPEDTFGGITPVFADYISDRNLYKYYAGIFMSLSEAHKALEEVKAYGYKDAFVVPYFNKERISIGQAREIEFGDKLNGNI